MTRMTSVIRTQVVTENFKSYFCNKLKLVDFESSLLYVTRGKSRGEGMKENDNFMSIDLYKFICRQYNMPDKSACLEDTAAQM